MHSWQQAHALYILLHAVATLLATAFLLELLALFVVVVIAFLQEVHVLQQ
jgi:hypothetical protein